MDATYFQDDAVDKQLKIEYDGGMITNEELHSEEFELTERLCSESQLRFGSCEAATLKFKISNVVMPLKGKWITVTDTLEKDVSNILQFGKYKVDSDKPTVDHKYRDIVAYDAMYDITSADVADWYNTILPTADSTVTLKQFRDSFLSHFGIEQEDVELINDSMVVAKTVEPTSLSGKTVITAICEINGCFGHIGRNGKFQYVFLKEMVEGLYPSNTLYPKNDLYPADPMNAEYISGSHYISAKYEDFTTARINKLQIRQEEDDIGCIYGTGDNCYIVQDNFLAYGKSTKELQAIAANMYSVICKVWYQPAHVEAKGNPCLEVGAGIRLRTRYEIIYTYILQRTLKGIQALRDTYDAEGEQYQSEEVNSVRENIIQLKGKTNKLARNIEETRSEIVDIEKGLYSKITQNAESIAAEVKRAIGQEVELAASIKINTDNIAAEVSRASASEGKLASQISINAQQILLKVSKDSIISEINQTAEKITISAQKIDLKGLVNADELISKFATIVTLNATSANLQNLIADKASLTYVNALNGVVENLKTEKLSASEFTADNISAMNITVRSANVTGGFNANKITAGTLSVERLDVDGIIASMAARTLQCVNMTAQTVKGSSYEIYNGSGYTRMSPLVIAINGTSYALLGYRV